MNQQFPTPTDWKSEKWWENRSVDERLYHIRVPRRWSSIESPLPPKVSDWLENFEVGDSLYLYGPSGSGKTGIAVSALKKLVTKGLSGRFVSSDRYIEMLKDSFENDGLLPEMYSTPYLLKYIQGVFGAVVLDGVGNERETEFSTHEIGTLVRRRNEDMRTLLLTTTLSPLDFARRYGDRVSGSVNDMLVVRV
jgi:DNA replication protein DnaC